MTNDLVPIKEMKDIGNVLAQSGFFSDAKGEAQAVVKVLAGHELGFGPVTSMMGIHIVQGRVTLSANLIAAAIRKSDKYDYKVAKHTDKECVIEFYQDGKKIGESPFTIAEAQKAELIKPRGNWVKWPRNMLFARALSNGAKWYCPDVFTTGIYTPDELGAEIDGETGEVVEVESEVVEDETQAEPEQEDKPEPPVVTVTNGYSSADYTEFYTLAREYGLATPHAQNICNKYGPIDGKSHVVDAVAADGEQASFAPEVAQEGQSHYDD